MTIDYKKLGENDISLGVKHFFAAASSELRLDPTFDVEAAIAAYVTGAMEHFNQQPVMNSTGGIDFIASATVLYRQLRLLSSFRKAGVLNTMVFVAGYFLTKVAIRDLTPMDETSVYCFTEGEKKW